MSSYLDIAAKFFLETGGDDLSHVSSPPCFKLFLNSLIHLSISLYPHPRSSSVQRVENTNTTTTNFPMVPHKHMGEGCSQKYLGCH